MNFALLLVLMCFFSVRCIIAINLFGEGRAGLYASRSFVYLSCMCNILSFSFTLGVVRSAANCDCGTPWTFRFIFYLV